MDDRFWGIELTITAQALRVFATLEGMKSNREQDVIDAIIPFFMPVIGVMNGKVFDPNLFAIGLNTLYGWNVTEGVAEILQDRLQAQGYLVRPENSNARILLVNAPPEAMLPANMEYSDELTAIVERFQEFSSQLNDLLYRERPDAEMLDILVRFVVTLDLSGDRPPPGKRKSDLPEVLKPLEGANPSLDPDDRYLCARFVEASQDDAETMAQLARLAAVGMLTEVVQDFASPSLDSKKANLAVILDAPVALAAVGVAPKASVEDARLTIEALRKLGCSIMIFEETLEEMARVLNSILERSRQDRYGRIATAMLHQEVREDYVRVVARDPDKAVREAGFDIKMMDLKSFPNLHIYFDQKAFDDFHAAITWNPGQPTGIRHDAIAMALVTRLRETQRSADVFESRYVFTTINTRFAALAKSFLVERQLLRSRYSPPVVRYAALATAAWLKTGFGASNTVPITHLLAYCERILSVKKEVVDRARELLKSIDPEKEKQLNLLLLDARSTTRMMDMTLGEADALRFENVGEVLDEMKRATAGEVAAEYETKLRQQRKKQQEKVRDMTREIDGRDEAIRALEAEAAEARDRAGEQEQRLDDEFIAALERNNAVVGTWRRLATGAIVGTAIYLWFNAVVDASPLNGVLHSVNLGLFGYVLAVGATYFSVMRLLQLPTLGVGDALNMLGIWSFKRRLEKSGLIRHRLLSAVKWSYGTGELPSSIRLPRA